MPNWYQNLKDPPTSRYTGTMSANIQVPENVDKEQEQDSAYAALNETLQSSSPVSTAGVDITIQRVELYV